MNCIRLPLRCFTISWVHELVQSMIGSCPLQSIIIPSYRPAGKSIITRDKSLGPINPYCVLFLTVQTLPCKIAMASYQMHKLSHGLPLKRCLMNLQLLRTTPHFVKSSSDQIRTWIILMYDRTNLLNTSAFRKSRIAKMWQGSCWTIRSDHEVFELSNLNKCLGDLIGNIYHSFRNRIKTKLLNVDWRIPNISFTLINFVMYFSNVKNLLMMRWESEN